LVGGALFAIAAAFIGSAANAKPATATAEPQQARNVILFLGDAGGLPTLNAAGILAHDKPQSLFIHAMPHVGLSDTSSTDRWVTDSAAGMTAIMTGHKTGNGVVSMAPGAGGAPLKTLLEYAEERGLSTGVVTNMNIWDATPAACYAHVPSRKNKNDIFAQMLAPRFGNGVDILLGKGKADALASYAARGTTAEKAFASAGYRFGEDPALIGTSARAVVLRDEEYAPIPAVTATVQQLARNSKGYFLMVEWDMHTDDPQKGLRHAIEMDDMIRQISAIASKDTLIVFTADHSFGLRLMEGKRGTPLAAQFAAEAAKPGSTPASNGVISVEDGHSGEEVIVAASGPGAERVHGFFANTKLFDVMLAALGWPKDE
jgi:alkaline phosphatase